MVNCNPETVSTDYDTSDRLYFEPLTPEDLANVIAAEQAASEGEGRLVGVIVSLGGQTPLKLAAGIPRDLVLGTSPTSIDLAEDREQWNALCARLGIAQPPGGTATTAAEAVAVASTIGYPVLVRPSYVLGGRAMEIVYDDDRLVEAVEAMSGVGGTLGREGGVTADRPVLVDRFLEDAVEVDVDAVRDGTGDVVICGVMEHVEEAGVHSGDSACALPPQTLTAAVVAELEHSVRVIAEALDVCGLINVQFAVKDEQAYVLEANPRASRTVPFVAKATGVPVAMVAARVMVGATLAELRDEGLLRTPVEGHVSVKEAVMPFNRFPEVDTLLGPEMRSTGEVMGIGATFGLAFAKSQIAAGNRLPVDGTVFFSLADRDKAGGLEVARQFASLGFDLAATSGTAAMLESEGIPVATVVTKVGESHPGVVDAVDLIAGGKVQLVVNTPRGRGPRADGVHIRSTALAHLVPCLTTVAAAKAAAAGIADWIRHPLSVQSLQEYHRR
jgi:carbamoyl-phosphate synthase large subunit